MSTRSILVAIMLSAIVAFAGCKKTQQAPPKQAQESEKPKPQDNQAKTEQQPKTQTMPGAADERDSAEPRVAGLFPKSGAVGQWVKVRPVTFHPADKLADLGGGYEAGYQAFGVDWAADMTYQLGDQPSQRVLVQLFHCPTSKDAYALMSVQSVNALGSRFGPGTDARGDDLTAYINKGQFMLLVWAIEQRQSHAGSFKTALAELAQNIADSLPPASVVRPDLLANLPTTGLGHPRAQYHRGGFWLSKSPFATELRLDNDDDLLLAEYSFKRWNDAQAEPLVIFIARYSSDAEAKEAHDRLDRVQTEAADWGMQLLVLGSKGHYVYGTLTAELYGLMEDAVYRGRRDAAADYPVQTTLEAILP